MLREMHMSTPAERRAVPQYRVEELFEVSRPDTGHVTVLFTELGATLKALAVARGLGRALGAGVSVVALQTPTYQPRGVAASSSASDVELETLQSRLRAAGDVRVRVFAAPHTNEALRLALAPGSLVVLGGRRRWWPTAASHLHHLLEALGHYVVFVDEVSHAA
jgi:hypothetical protein